MKRDYTIETKHGLDMTSRKPIISLYGSTALVDTGSDVPVFSMSEKQLKSKFGNARKVSERTNITGFGGDCYGYIYELDHFEIGKLSFEPLQVFVPETPMEKYPMIISAAMLYGLDYDIDTNAGLLTLRIPPEIKLPRTATIEKDSDGLYVNIQDGTKENFRGELATNANPVSHIKEFKTLQDRIDHYSTGSKNISSKSKDDKDLAER